jgi:glutamine synthetase
LHEKPFAGVNGSGKHNNWSMGTDTGHNLLEPGETPEDNAQFLFFCAAVIAAVDKHQALLRASVAAVGQDHRLGANEAPPAIISIFLGQELENAFNKVATGKGRRSKRGLMGLGTEVLPQLPMHGGDRNRTSPFAFTGNKFEFRALGSSMSLGFVNAVLNTIVAESVDALSTSVEKKLKANKGDLGVAVSEVVKEVWEKHNRIVFDGDGYSEEWHAEAEKRGLMNLRTTPDALPWIVNKQTVTAFETYNVLSKRELESRYEVLLEQYATKLNIEGETAASMARTMILPAAVRHLSELRAAGLDEITAETEGLVNELWTAIGVLESANLAENQPDDEALKWSKYMRDKVIPAMDGVRAVADRLESVVADDLWPLPKYSEMLFIK